MTAIALLEDLTARGITVRANGDKIRLEATKGAVTQEIQELVRRFKPELLALLVRRSPKPSQPCFACHTLSWREYPEGGWVCDVCHPILPERVLSADLSGDNLAGAILRLAETLDWPRWEFAPGRSVGSKVNWHRFAATASQAELRAAQEALSGEVIANGND